MTLLEIVSGVDNSLSSHVENPKNNSLILCEAPTLGINGRFGTPEKKFSMNFSKANTKLVWGYILIIVIVVS